VCRLLQSAAVCRSAKKSVAACFSMLQRVAAGFYVCLESAMSPCVVKCGAVGCSV